MLLLVIGCDDSVVALDGFVFDAASDAAETPDFGIDADQGSTRVDGAVDDAAPDAAADAEPDAVPDGTRPDAWVEGDAAPDAAVADAAAADMNPEHECPPGASRACGSEVGRCLLGAQSCDAEGRWGRCLGGLGPVDEACNGVDDDCDERVDEGLARACGDRIGACQPGRQLCEDGAWGLCDGADEGGPEACDGLDDDCDGEVDEGLTRPCGDETGRCTAGVETCEAGVWGACEGGTLPRAESCDDVDDDCDGIVDEGIFVRCGAGACDGIRRCEGGGFGACVPEAPPVPEVCNDVDDDCDGEVDEVVVRPCGDDTGSCASGVETCTRGQWSRCVGAVGPSAETCDGADEDCDGAVDEALLQRCGNGTGACVRGEQSCREGLWGLCNGGVAPREETCDGVDQDCDGATDEGYVSVMCGDVEGCVFRHTECVDGGEVCVGDAPVAEVCDGFDNDCDGAADEGLNGDRDLDGLGDCVETLAGLDPDDPADAGADPDHDGVTTGDEVVAGTPWWPVLSLVDLGSEVPGVVEVALVVGQRTEALQPQIAEVLLRYSRGRAVLEGSAPGAAALLADKEVAVQDLGDSRIRVVVVAPNLNALEPGVLATMRLRRVGDRPLQFFLLAESRLAPPAANDALTYGVGHGAEPLRYE